MDPEKQKKDTDDQRILKKETAKQAVIELIKEFRPGDRFYSVRALTKMLNINRGVSELILKQLVSQELLYSVPAQGYYVAENYLQEPPPPVYGSSSAEIYINEETDAFFTPYRSGFEYFINLGHSFPDPKVVRIQNYLSLYARIYTNYNYPGGKFINNLNDTVKTILLRRGLLLGGQRFCVLPSVALSLVAEVMVFKAACVVLANWGDAEAEAPFLRCGAEVAYTGSDEQGMLVQKIKSIGQRKKVSLVIIRPFSSIPYRRKLSPERIAGLMELAAKMDFVVLSLELESEIRLHSGNPFIQHPGGYDRVVSLRQVCNSFSEFKDLFAVSGPDNLIRAVENKQRNRYPASFDVMRCLTLVKMEEKGLLVPERRRLEGYYELCLGTVLEAFHTYLGGAAEVHVPDDGLSLYIRLGSEISFSSLLDWMMETGLFCAAFNKHAGARLMPVRAFILNIGWPDVGTIQQLFMKLEHLIQQNNC